MNRVHSLPRIPLFNVAWTLMEVLVAMLGSDYSDEAIADTAFWLRRLSNIVAETRVDYDE